MDRIQRLPRLLSPPDIGLVGHYQQSIAVGFQVMQRFRNARKYFQFMLRWRREWLAIANKSPVNNTVTVKENSTPFSTRRHRFPFGRFHLYRWMRYEQMPDHRLEGFRVRRDMDWVHRGNQNAGIGDRSRVTAIAAYDADDLRANQLRIFQRGDQIWAYILLEVPTTNRENQQQIFGAQTTGAQPTIEDRTPTFIVGARCKFRNIVGGSVSLNACDLAKVVDGMRSIGGTTTHAENEQASTCNASVGDQARSFFDAGQIQLRDDLGCLGEKTLGKAFLMQAAAHFSRAPRYPRNLSSPSILRANLFHKSAHAPLRPPILRDREALHKHPPGPLLVFQRKLLRGRLPGRNRCSSCALCDSFCCTPLCAPLQIPRCWRPTAHRYGIPSSAPTYRTARIRVRSRRNRKAGRSRHRGQKNVLQALVKQSEWPHLCPSVWPHHRSTRPSLHRSRRRRRRLQSSHPDDRRTGLLVGCRRLAGAGAGAPRTVHRRFGSVTSGLSLSALLNASPNHRQV